MLVIGEKKVSVYQTKAKVISSEKNINSTQSTRNGNSGSPNISGGGGIKTGSSSGGSGNNKTTISIDKKN